MEETRDKLPIDPSLITVEAADQMLRQSEMYLDGLDKVGETIDRKADVFLGISVSMAVAVVGYSMSVVQSASYVEIAVLTAVGAYIAHTTRLFMDVVKLDPALVVGSKPALWYKGNRLAATAPEAAYIASQSHQKAIEHNTKRCEGKANRFDAAMSRFSMLPTVFALAYLVVALASRA